MNVQKLYDALDICLNAMDNGASIEACLQLFPALAPELRPLLQAASAAKQTSKSPLSAQVFHRSRTKILANAELLRNKNTTQVFRWHIPRLAFAIVFVLLVLVFGAGGLLVTSAQSLPGDQIYPLKLVLENVRIRLSPNENLRSMEEQYNQRRVSEVQSILDMGRSVPVIFTGEIEDQTPEFWIIDDILVKTTDQTIIIGDVGVGTVVEVKGITQPDGWVIAGAIHLQAKEYSGIVEILDEDMITISGKQFLVLTESQIDPRIKVGDPVLALLEATDENQIAVRAVLRLPDSANP